MSLSMHSLEFIYFQEFNDSLQMYSLSELSTFTYAVRYPFT